MLAGAMDISLAFGRNSRTWVGKKSFLVLYLLFVRKKKNAREALTRKTIKLKVIVLRAEFVHHLMKLYLDWKTT